MKVDNNVTYRKLNSNDLDIFVRLRLDFLSEMKNLDEIEKEKITKSLQGYFAEYLRKNEFIGIVCEHEGNIVSTAYLAISEMPANHHLLNGKIGTLLNVFTYPEYRNNGISTNIIKMLIEEARKRNVLTIDLLATKDGERIYRKIGFAENEEKFMRLKLHENNVEKAFENFNFNNHGKH